MYVCAFLYNYIPTQVLDYLYLYFFFSFFLLFIYSYFKKYLYCPVNKYCRQDGIWNRTLIGEKFKVDCSTDLNNGIVKRKVRIW